MSETKVKTPIIESIVQRSKYTKDDESYIKCHHNK